MIITEIKKIGKGLRYNVYVDEHFEGIFEAEILAKYKLKTGQEVTRDEFEKIKIANGDYVCFDRGLGVLEKGMKTEKMIFDYLKQKAYPEECITRAIDKLKDYGYINDEVYAENYIKTYSSSKGRKKIKYDLMAKGVDSEIIENKLVECVSEEEQLSSCQRIVDKWLRNKTLDVKTKQKLYNHLASKGFDFSVISKIVGGLNAWD